jgi:hypothetical protein
VIRFDVLSETLLDALKKGLLIVMTAEMSLQPTYDDFGSNDGKRPSQPNEQTRNILDATQALETMASLLVKALVKV